MTLIGSGVELGRHRFLLPPLLGQRAATLFTALVESCRHHGDVAECGVSGGDTSLELVRYLEAWHPDKLLHLCDAFASLQSLYAPQDNVVPDAVHHCTLPPQVVQWRLAPYRRWRLHQGFFHEVFAHWQWPLCFIFADGDLYRSTVDCIALADAWLVPGGTLVIDDYATAGASTWAGVKAAVDAHLDWQRYRIEFVPHEGNNTVVVATKG